MIRGSRGVSRRCLPLSQHCYLLWRSFGRLRARLSAAHFVRSDTPRSGLLERSQGAGKRWQGPDPVATKRPQAAHSVGSMPPAPSERRTAAPMDDAMLWCCLKAVARLQGRRG